MFRIKPIWWLPITISLLLGIVCIIPIPWGKVNFLNYPSLSPYSPFGLVVFWLIAWAFYRLGRWFTLRPLR